MRTDITDLTHEEFLNLRTGIGGSDAGIILGLSEYISSYEMWGIKSGLLDKEDIDNKYSFMGRYLEDVIVDLYKYWKGDFESVMSNMKAGKIVNEVEDRKYHYKDDKEDWLQASPDRIVKDHYRRKGEGVLEVKTIAGWVANKYEAGLPPQYYAQIQHNMMVTGLQWGDFVVLKDGRDLEVFHIKRNDDFISDLRKREEEFWNRVLKTREAVKNNKSYEEFEPPIDGTEAFANFMKRQYKGEEETILGTKEDLRLVELIDMISKQVKELEGEKRLHTNTLQHKMKNATVLDLGEDAKVTWRPNKNGVRSFRIQYK